MNLSKKSIKHILRILDNKCGSAQYAAQHSGSSQCNEVHLR